MSEKRVTVKQFEELSFRDDFMFGKVMQDPGLCRDVIECLLGRSIGELTEVQSQKEFKFTKDGKWIRLQAEVVEDSRRDAKVSMLENHPELKMMYSADDDNTEVLYLKNAKAIFCSFTEPPRVVEF